MVYHSYPVAEEVVSRQNMPKIYNLCLNGAVGARNIEKYIKLFIIKLWEVESYGL